jgi:hypothetical protein
MWYKFTAYNSETCYGWTQDQKVAEAALAQINDGKDVNLYAMEELSDSDDEADGGETPLSKRDGHIFNDDTTVADYAEAKK